MLALRYDLLKLGVPDKLSACSCSFLKQRGFALILEVSSTKTSMNRLICETLKKQYVFITEFTLSAPRTGKPVSIDLIFIFKFILFHKRCHKYKHRVLNFSGARTKIAGQGSVKLLVDNSLKSQWISTHSEIVYSTQQCSNFQFYFMQTFSCSSQTCTFCLLKDFLLCRKFAPATFSKL